MDIANYLADAPLEPTERESVEGTVFTTGERARAIVVTNLTHAGLDLGRLVYARTCWENGVFDEWTEAPR